MDAISSIRNKAMKFTEEFTKKCLEAVINDLKNECIKSLDNGRLSLPVLEGDFWIDIYNPDNEETFSINYSWDYTVDDDDFDIVLPVSIVAYPTEEYEKDGKTFIREIATGDCVVISGDDK